jgi:hypothetical protein
VGGVVDDLTGGGSHAGRGHDVLGERLRALDAGGLLGRAETGDPGRAHGVGHAEYQGDLGPDDDEVGAESFGQVGDRFPRGHVHLVLGGQRSGPGIAGRHRQRVDLGVSAQRKQQRVFTGSGSDYQDVHRTPP